MESFLFVRDVMIGKCFIDMCSLIGILKDHRDITTYHDDSNALIEAIPAAVKKIAVLDRTKEPGADGEPLYKDVITSLAQYHCDGSSKFSQMPKVTGGRYGLSSKEFTPAMIKGV